MIGGHPAFPAESYATGDGGRRPVQYSGMTQRAYFAAHAPEVPENYAWKRVEAVATDSFGRKGVIACNEPAMERLVRWRLEYADAMLKALK